MLQTLLDSCAALGVPLTAAQAEQLCDFGARLLEQNRVMNLTAITEPQAVAKLHFADCLALLRIVPFSGKRVIDVGCGAGFPGVPLAIFLHNAIHHSFGKRGVKHTHQIHISRIVTKIFILRIFQRMQHLLFSSDIATCNTFTTPVNKTMIIRIKQQGDTKVG